MKKFGSLLLIGTFGVALSSASAELINLESLTMSAYHTRQDRSPEPTFLQSEGGYQISMRNSWKHFLLEDDDGNPISQPLSPQTVISFDVKFGSGTELPEFVSIGLDSDSHWGVEHRFLLHSGDDVTTLAGGPSFPQGVVDPSWYHELGDGWFRYSIPVGEEDTTGYSYNALYLISDDDGSTGNGKNGYVEFRNIRIYENEGSPSFSSVYVGEDVWVDGNIVLGGGVVDHLGNSLLSGSPSGLELHGSVTLGGEWNGEGRFYNSIGDVNVENSFFTGGFNSGWGNATNGNGGRNFFGDANSVTISPDSTWSSGNIFLAGNQNSFEIGAPGNSTSLALGDYNVMRKTYSSVFIGYQNTVPSEASDDFGWGYVFGSGNKISTTGMALGWVNEITGLASQSMGVGLKAEAYLCSYVGNYNSVDVENPPNSTESRPEDPVFVVGNGTYQERSTALEVLRNGDVIINKPQGDISMGIFGSQ